MKRLLNGFVLALVGMAFLAPLAEVEHCDDGCEVAGETHCACVHHVQPTLMIPEPARLLGPSRPERFVVFRMASHGRQSTTDIFRPPTAA